MNPSPLSKLKEGSVSTAASSTPIKELPTPVTPSHLARSSPRPRRTLAERGTPRSSRLGQQVFSAEDDDKEDGDASDKMDLDEDK
jgi:hypothetical protein